jgi:molybdopterin/thiamine biosynthesis adenylyltransferase
MTSATATATLNDLDTAVLTAASTSDSGDWSYEEAFSRHDGLLSTAEQKRLRYSRVAIAGMGGVGGIHLITLARLGVGKFTIADPDCFETANFNRQYGANVRTLGQNKALTMKEGALAINPDLKIRAFPEAITPKNVEAFLDGVDLLVDGIDFFALDVRRLLFREARRRGIWAVTAGPIGMSTAWLTFSPTGMSFDDYFDFASCYDGLDEQIAFLLGLTPAATQRTYMDLSRVDPKKGKGPSAGLACQLCSGVATAEALKILLHRGPVKAAPYYFQFDAYRQQFRQGRLRWGNRGLLQRLKRRKLRQKLIELGWLG